MMLVDIVCDPYVC